MILDYLARLLYNLLHSLYRGFIMSTSLFALEQGRTWFATGTDLNVAASSSFYFGLRTGVYPLKSVSRKIGTAANDMIVKFYEDQAFTGGFKSGMPNRNRLAQREPSFATFAFVTPDGTPSGLFYTSPLKSSTTDYVDFKSESPVDSIILKPNTDYLIEIKNNDIASAVFDYAATYEEIQIGVTS